MSVFLLRGFIRKKTWREKRKRKKVSEKLKYQNFRSIEVSTGNKRIKYLPEENIIIKGSGLFRWWESKGEENRK
jgi:hypothetical protein